MNLILLENVNSLALIICAIVMLIPIAILIIIAFTKLLVKNIKRNRKKVETKEDVKNKFLVPFGEGNIVSISKNMNRVTVEVKDINMVNFEGLKNLGVGILISGNTVKCSSSLFAQNVEEK